MSNSHEKESASNWRVVVVGPGSLGRLFGGLLARDGQQVTFGVRSEQTKSVLEEQGLKIEGVESFDLPPSSFRVCLPEQAIKADTAFFCVKSYDLSSALSAWLPLLPEKIPLLFWQNGAGFWEAVQEKCAAFYPYACVTTFGANLKGEAVHFAGAGVSHLFALNAPFPREEALLKLLSRVGLRPKCVPDQNVLWQKLQINAAVNPLATLLSVRNGYLREEPHARKLLLKAFEEAGALLAAPSAQAESAVLEEVLANTSQNINSMLQDARAGKPLEIEAISGFLLQRASRKGLEAPYTAFLYHLLLARYRV